MADLPFDISLVREKMREQKISQAELARHLKLNQSAVSNILNGTRQVKVQEASDIYSFIGIRREPQIDLVPIIGLSSAGNWREAILVPGGVMPVPRGVAGSRAFAVEVKGDSMDRIIPDGGFAIVDPDQSQLYNDKIYLIENVDFETQVKLYRSNPARFEPVSRDTETHRTILVGDGHIRVIGRVVWQGAPL